MVEHIGLGHLVIFADTNRPRAICAGQCADAEFAHPTLL